MFCKRHTEQRTRSVADPPPPHLMLSELARTTGTHQAAEEIGRILGLRHRGDGSLHDQRAALLLTRGIPRFWNKHDMGIVNFYIQCTETEASSVVITQKRKRTGIFPCPLSGFRKSAMPLSRPMDPQDRWERRSWKHHTLFLSCASISPSSRIRFADFVLSQFFFESESYLRSLGASPKVP